jgi:hypothetical protein
VTLRLQHPGNGVDNSWVVVDNKYLGQSLPTETIFGLALPS